MKEEKRKEEKKQLICLQFFLLVFVFLYFFLCFISLRSNHFCVPVHCYCPMILYNSPRGLWCKQHRAQMPWNGTFGICQMVWSIHPYISIWNIKFSAYGLLADVKHPVFFSVWSVLFVLFSFIHNFCCNVVC